MLLAVIAPAAFAEGEPAFYVEAPSSAKIGDTITVKVSLAGEYNANTLNLRLHYNGDSFKFAELTEGEVLTSARSGAIVLCQAVEEQAFITCGIIAYTDEGFNAQGLIFEVKFTVLSTAAAGNEFELEVLEFDRMGLGDTTATSIPFTSHNATVNVTGGTGTAAPTTAPYEPPISPDTTPVANTTDAPGADTTEAASETQHGGKIPGESSMPVLDPNATGTGKGDIDISELKTPGADDKQEPGANDGEGEGERGAGSVLLKVGVGILGLAAAFGLGWLGVHFIKKGKQAHDEGK